ncbi:MAG: copper resistance CopC family protein [Ornithinimicrobium sp.]
MSRDKAVWRQRCAGAAVLLAATVLGPVEAAQAHDELVDTVPTDGAEIDTPPGEVRLEFTGEIAAVGTVVVVTGPLGEATDGDPEVEGTAVVQPLTQDAPPGDYTVVWRVTSQDGHPISGELDYTVPSAGIEAQATPTGEDSTAATQAPDRDTDAATSTAEDLGDNADRAANTAAVPVQGDESQGAGTSPWVWGVLVLALLTLAGLGANVAVRRR